MTTAIQFENVSKQYRLGQVGTGTLSHDLQRAWAKLRGKPDPFAKIGTVNNREESGGEYVWALRDVNFEVAQGEILGIIGRNGAGKSTLLKLLSRVTTPTTGTIRAKGRIASLLEVGTGFHPELTGRENIYLNGAILGMTAREVTKRLEEIIEFSGCAKYVDTPVKRYSSGMTVRLGFAVAAHLECEVLIVDEVLAVGDAEFQAKCLAKMQSITEAKTRTVLFVTHNLASVRRLCTRAILLANGGVVDSGSPDRIIQRHLAFRTGDSPPQLTNLSGPLSFDFQIESVSINGHRISAYSQELPDSSEMVFRVRAYTTNSSPLDFGIAISCHDMRLGTLIGKGRVIGNGMQEAELKVRPNTLRAGSFQFAVGASDPVNRSRWAWGQDAFEITIQAHPSHAHPLSKGILQIEDNLLEYMS